MHTRPSYANAGNFTIPFPFPRPYDAGLCYYILAPDTSASFGLIHQRNAHIARLQRALSSLPESDVNFFRQLAKAFIRYGKLAAIFRLFIAYEDGVPQVAASTIRYLEVEDFRAGPQEVVLDLDWRDFNRRIVVGR